MEKDDKPFECSATGCGQRFTNEDHLAVHMRKHEMSLALNLGGPVIPGTGKSPSSLNPGLNFVDQTPTPTKFLRNCEEIGLFQDLKNPFEEAFKKALDPESSDGSSSPFPGPGCNELNTPVPPIPKTVDDIQSVSGKHVNEATKSDLHALVHTRRKLKESSLISSSSDGSVVNKASTLTTNKEDDVIMIDEEQNNKVSTSSMTLTSRSTTLVTAAQSTTLSPPESTLSSSTFPSSTILQPPVLLQTTAATTPQLAMQVFLQLPTGQTIPVQIPATLNPQGLQVVPPRVEKPVVASMPSFISTGVLPTSAQAVTSINQAVTSINQAVTSTIVHPTISPSPVTQTQNEFTKQKLKLALQSQSLPSPKQTVKVIHVSPDNKPVQPSPVVTPIRTVTSIPAPSPILTAENLATLPGASAFATSLASLPGAVQSGVTSPLSVDQSYLSDTASSPDPADSTVTIKRARREEEGDDRRRKFLERNRAAAARCRQKRKTWINNLERKGDELQSTNSRLQSEVNLLRTEVAQLKTLLLAHKDCPVTLQQRQAGQLPFPINEATMAANPVIDDPAEGASDLSKPSCSKFISTNRVTIPVANLVTGGNLLPGATVINKSIATAAIIPPSVINNKKLTIIPRIIKTEPIPPKK